MKTLRDGAVLLILLTLLVSVRVTPLEEPQSKGGIIPEARASMEPAGLGSAQSDGDNGCPLRVKTFRTEQGNSQVIVIEVEEVEATLSPRPTAPSGTVANTTC